MACDQAPSLKLVEHVLLSIVEHKHTALMRLCKSRIFAHVEPHPCNASDAAAMPIFFIRRSFFL